MPILAVLALAGFCSALSVRLLDPLVPAIARDMLVEPETTALLASAFAFPYALGQPILGPLGDFLGKARVINACLLVLALALALCAVAPNIETLFAARVLTGLSSGGIIPLVFAAIGDRVPMEERQATISKALAAILLGGMAGGLLSGLIGTWLGWRSVLWLVAGTTALTVAVTMLSLKPRGEAVRQQFTVAGVRQGYASVFANPKAVICYTAVFIEGIAIFGIMPYIALILEERSLGSMREAGFIIAGFGLGGIVFTLIVGWLLRTLNGQLNMIRAGGLVCAAALISFALGDTWLLKVAAFLSVGLGFYMIHNSMQTQATELAPAARGAAVALHAFFFFLGHAAGPIVYGAVREATDTVTATALAAAVIALLGFWTAWGLSRSPRPRGE